MNEGEQIDVLKCVTITVALVQNLPFCVKSMATGPPATHHVSVQSVEPFPRYGKEMRTCTRLYPPGTAHARTYLISTFIKKQLS